MFDLIGNTCVSLKERNDTSEKHPTQIKEASIAKQTNA